jgi:NAD(P)H-hydrate epimerase
MVNLITIEQTRKIEAEADADGFSYAQMMDNAGYATARHAMYMLRDIPDIPRITILVGSGNNGGDGLVAGKYLAEDGRYQVRFYLYKRLDTTYAPFADILGHDLFVAYAEDDHDGRVLRHMVASADLVIDALLGIGARAPIQSDLARILRTTKQAIRERRSELSHLPIIHPTDPTYLKPKHTPQILAIDCPSGVNCDTGEIDDNTLHADVTITFIAPKVGLVKYPAADAVGELIVAPINIPNTISAMQAGVGELVTGDMIKSYLPHRPSQSNKGSFGKALVIGGSANYIGAVRLSALGVLRAGAGLVTVATPAPVATILASNLAEPTWLPLPHENGILSSDSVMPILNEIGSYDALLIGPGLGRTSSTEHFIDTFLMGYKSNAPNLVLDADALNILSKIDNWWTLLPPNTIITPHPGEMARLCQLSTADVQANRWELALEKAKAWRVIILLKGAYTAIATPQGDLYVLPFKNDALATAGTGDILAGLITGLIASGATPVHATIAGGYIHGLAGEIAYQRHNDGRSVIASDVLDCIPQACGQINVMI